MEIALQQLRSALDTHFAGAFLFCRAVGRQLVRQGKGGRVVLMSPVTAVGPARALQQILGAGGSVVATVIAGDNYVVEETESARPAIPGMI